LSLEDVRLFIEKSHLILILCHSNADPDALAGALALKRNLPGKEIHVLCDGISKPAKILLEALGEDIIEDGLEITPDSIVVLDTSSPELLGECRKYLELTDNICLIDHHSTCLFDPFASYRRTSTSNSELVWEVLGRSADVVSRKALLAGILADTGHLKFANRGTFSTISEMLGEDIVFEDVFSIMRDDHDSSKTIALFKALQRMKVKRIDEFILVKTNIGSHESFIAKNIMGLGADVVLIVNDRKGQRIVGRANKSAVDKGVDLSSIMEDIGSKYGGEGGGHPPAAGMLGIDDYKHAAEDIIEAITEALED